MSLVLSLVSWLGPWTVVPHQTATGWARSIEAAVGRIVSARSRFLLWSTWARPPLHLKFALAFAAVSHELRRVGGRSPPPDNVTACPALEASFAVFAWSILPGSTWSTPLGHFAPGFVTRTVLLHVAEDSWLRLLWAAAWACLFTLVLVVTRSPRGHTLLLSGPLSWRSSLSG